jgi:hypothetical protein
MDSITILTAPSEGLRLYLPVSKTIRRDGTIKKPIMSKTWQTRKVQIACLRDLLSVLTQLENSDNTILIRGEFVGGNPNQTARQKTEFQSAPHNWAMIDVDEILLPDNIDPLSPGAAEHVISIFPPIFNDVDYICLTSALVGQV